VSAGALAGCGVLITRPEHQSHELAAAVGAVDGTAYRFPAMDIIGRDIDAVRQEFAALETPDIVLFVSSNAVTHGFAVAGKSGAKIAAIGPATRAAIEALGGTVDIDPGDGYDSEHLLEHAALQRVGGRKIVIVRGQSGRETLARALDARGASVNYLCVYRRRAHRPSTAEIENIEAVVRQGKIQFVTVASVETLEHLLQILPPQSLERLRQSTLVAPSTRVLQTASELLPGIPAVLAPGPQAPVMVETLIRQWQTGKNHEQKQSDQ
jgi:uroporphyrinogen-III synthase